MGQSPGLVPSGSEDELVGVPREKNIGDKCDQNGDVMGLPQIIYIYIDMY